MALQGGSEIQSVVLLVTSQVTGNGGIGRQAG